MGSPPVGEPVNLRLTLLFADTGLVTPVRSVRTERELAHLQVEQEALGHTRPSLCGGSNGSFSETETWSLLSSTNHVFGPVRLLLIPGKWARTPGRPPGPLGDVARLVPKEGLTKAVAFTGFPWSWPQQLLPAPAQPPEPCGRSSATPTSEDAESPGGTGCAWLGPHERWLNLKLPGRTVLLRRPGWTSLPCFSLFCL